MSGKIDVNLTVLFAHELRLAASLLQKAHETGIAQDIVAALKACDVALYNVNDNPIVVVTLNKSDIKEMAIMRDKLTGDEIPPQAGKE